MTIRGDVDSSVGAAMLRRQRFDVVGVFMRLGPGETVAADEQIASSR